MPIPQLSFDPLPLPDDTPVKVEENRQQDKMQQAQRVPPGAGFAGRGGQMAYIANNILTGWMAGRHVKAEKELNKAKNEVTSARSIYDTLAQNYSQNIAAGKSKDDPEMKKMAEDITSSWNNYLVSAEKYTAPEDEGKGGKKKGTGEKIKSGAMKMFGMDVHPEMFRAGALNILKKSGPPVLNQEMSVQDKEALMRMKGEQTELDARKQELERKNRWGELAKIDPKQRTPEQTQEMEGLERQLFPKTTKQQAEDDILKTVLAGGQLTPAQKELGENLGILRHKQSSSVWRKDAANHDWLVTIDEDGKEISRRDYGKGYTPPDQADIVKRIMQNQMDVMVREYKKSFADKGIDPKQLDQDAHKFALATISGYKGFGMSPVEAERTQFKLNDAIKSVMSEVPKKDRDIFSNFVVTPDDAVNGLYMYRSNVVDPQGSKGSWWWKQPTFYGGLSQEELASQENLFRQRLATALKKKNPKATDAEIAAMMPPSIYQSRQMGATPGEGQQVGRQMSPTPGHGGNHYQAVLPDGQVVAEDVTEAEKEVISKDPRFKQVQFNVITGPSQDQELNRNLNATPQ